MLINKDRCIVKTILISYSFTFRFLIYWIFGENIYIHTNDKIFTTNIRIYVFEQTLLNDQFIRISHSVIIRKNAIKRIKSALSQKFYLTLNNGDIVDVTQTYYYKFKDYYGI